MRLLHLYISSAHNYFGHHGQPAGREPMVEIEEIQCVAGKGIKGDRFFDFKNDFKGQITFFANETYERLCEQLGESGRSSSVFRRNVITQGVDLNTLIGKEFEVQGVRFIGTQEAAPCHWMNEAFAEGAERALRGFGGLRARILTDGILKRE
ncbi:MAG: molybdenum cofactor biosysynthesis protein [Verrucomicrobiaceae bacterium]|nr:molybdenum cofactor biosysynthesis protein [Verrucomicrobiaceae bacterium]MDB6119460.1 molybdenum cofactor biosysynthesis protein [Verrucomicrobiaceae bacterium]